MENQAIQNDSLLVCEYSLMQQAFHIETLAEAIENNLAGILEGYAPDYLPIAVVNGYEAAESFCACFREVLENGADTAAQRPSR